MRRSWPLPPSLPPVPPTGSVSVLELLTIAQVKALIAIAWALEDLGRIEEEAAGGTR